MDRLDTFRKLVSRVASTHLVLLIVALPGCRASVDTPSADLDAPGSKLPNLPRAVAPGGPDPGLDSVTAAPGKTYPAQGLSRWLKGDLHRDLWEIPVRVPVLNLDSVGGELTPEELTGGVQTLGLRFQGRDGSAYQFRSIVKNSSALVPRFFGGTFAADLIDDQMAAQFPFGAAVAARLAEALGLPVAMPRLVVMPDDPLLGPYRHLFAGRMGWIELRPEDFTPWAPPFAGSDQVVDTDDLIARMATEPGDSVDSAAYLTARLLDLLVGDWDRHQGQWFWAGYRRPEGVTTIWVPIPRDRDWAFPAVDGILPRLAGLYYPSYVGFGPEYPSIARLARSGRFLDRRFLSGLSRDDFVRAAQGIRQALTDDLLRRAIDALPPAHRRLVADDLYQALVSRRDALTEAAEAFHASLD